MDYILPLAVVGVGYYIYNMTPSLESLKGDASFTLYHWSKCGHCKAMMPEFDSLGRWFEAIRIRKVEASENNEYSVEAFPKLIYRKGAFIEEYTGARTASAMKAYLKQKNDKNVEDSSLIEREDKGGAEALLGGSDVFGIFG